LALILSRNADFSEVLNSVRQGLPSLDGIGTGSVKQRAANHFVAQVGIQSDPSRPATIHVLVYNLFVPPDRASSRSRKTRTKR
jgi:hypothetical protein